MSQAGLLDIESSHPQIPTSFDGDSGTAIPVANTLTLEGLTVANGTYAKPVFVTASGATVVTNVQVAKQVTGAPVTSNDAGTASFDDTMFTVDPVTGFVQLKGGTIGLDTFTTDVGGPVVPDGAGAVDVTGTSIYSDGTVANRLTLNVQATANTLLIGAGAGSSVTELGPLSSGQLIIGSTGLPPVAASLTSSGGTITITPGPGSINLDLAGGTIAVDSVGTQTGTNPIVPTAAGLITINGAVVAAGTNPVRSDGTGANTMAIEVQTSQALAATDATKIGLCNFNSTIFTVDANGFVGLSTTGLATTITGDSGGALSPVANNWNILGRSGSKTSGSGATLTIKSPPWSDKGASASTALNEGEFVTGAFTRTTPLTAGLADGDLIAYVATTASALVIQLSGTQVAHIGNVATTAGGSLSSTAIGDSVTLRYQASTDDFWATSCIGNWTLA